MNKIVLRRELYTQPQRKVLKYIDRSGWKAEGWVSWALIVLLGLAACIGPNLPTP